MIAFNFIVQLVCQSPELLISRCFSAIITVLVRNYALKHVYISNIAPTYQHNLLVRTVYEIGVKIGAFSFVVSGGFGFFPFCRILDYLYLFWYPYRIVESAK